MKTFMNLSSEDILDVSADSVTDSRREVASPSESVSKVDSASSGGESGSKVGSPKPSSKTVTQIEAKPVASATQTTKKTPKTQTMPSKLAPKTPLSGEGTITVRQVRSAIRTPRTQRRILTSLGLGALGSVKCLPAHASVLGMVAKIPHLVRIETH